MKGEIQMICAKEFIHSSAKGTFNLQESENFLRKIAAMNIPPADHDILIDAREVDGRPLKTVEIIRLIEVMNQNRDSFRNKVAFLLRHNSPEENRELTEYIAAVYDFYIKVFTDFEETITWLMHE